MTTVEMVEIGHGRAEHRRLTASTALVGYSDWPGLQQVFQKEPQSIICVRSAIWASHAS